MPKKPTLHCAGCGAALLLTSPEEVVSYLGQLYCQECGAALWRSLEWQD